jgi:hypothetical protein
MKALSITLALALTMITATSQACNRSRAPSTNMFSSKNGNYFTQVAKADNQSSDSSSTPVSHRK